MKQRVGAIARKGVLGSGWGDGQQGVPEESLSLRTPFGRAEPNWEP